MITTCIRRMTKEKPALVLRARALALSRRVVHRESTRSYDISVVFLAMMNHISAQGCLMSLENLSLLDSSSVFKVSR